MGELEVIGKKFDTVTSRYVAIYKLKSKKIDLGTAMKCNNCKFGNIHKNSTNRQITKVVCSLLHCEINTNTYKNMTSCLFFEK